MTNVVRQSEQFNEGKSAVKQNGSRPSETLRRLGGWSGGSIGQTEALAGINVQSESERKELWDKFKPLFSGDSQTLIDAVMDYCAAITLQRIALGELSLLPARICKGS